jgi:NAD(P)-dependent dehydrogenase (short-subunit alcohol dehydrogenase family)
MDGKTVLITGANSGIGFVTARELGKMGARVLMVCRDSERGARARTAVAQVATGAAPELLLADMSSQRAIRALADDVRQRFPRIDVLINNAGGIFAERGLTADGIERTFATNHLGPFLLTNLVLDLVKAGRSGRIVNVASAGGGNRLRHRHQHPRWRSGVSDGRRRRRHLDGPGVLRADGGGEHRADGLAALCEEGRGTWIVARRGTRRAAAPGVLATGNQTKSESIS